MPNLLAGAIPKPCEHGGVKRSEGDRGKDLRTHVPLGVQTQTLRQRVDHRQSQVVSIDPFLLLERRSLPDKPHKRERSIVVGGG